MFHFGRADGSDRITDFDVAADRIVLDDNIRLLKTKVQDVDRDGVKDLVLSFTAGTTVTLLGVSDASAIKYAAPDYYSDHQPGTDGLFDSLGDILANKFVELGHGF